MDALRKAFPWGKVAARQGRRMRGGRDYDVAPSLGPLSEGAVCPTGRLGECAYFRSKDLDALRKGSPWMVVLRAANSKSL